MMHKAWRSIEEVPYCFSRSSIKFHGHTGGKIDDLNPNWDYLAGRSYQIPQICLVLMGKLWGVVRECKSDWNFSHYTPTQWSWMGVCILDSSCLSVCRQHGFRSLLWNFNFKFHVHIYCGHRQKSPLFFSDVSFKMATWWPYWIFWFPDSNFSLALNIHSKLQ